MAGRPAISRGRAAPVVRGRILLRPQAPLAICAEPDDPAVQSLIRWDPTTSARAELQRRAEAGLPPARQVVQVDGAVADIADLLASLPDGTDVLGPRELTAQDVRVLLSSDDFAGLRDGVRRLCWPGGPAHGSAGTAGRPVALD